MRAARARAVAPSAGGRRSLQVALLALVAGVLLVVIGAGRPWAVLSAVVSMPAGRVPVATTSLHGNDFAPFSGLALLALVLIVGVAVTRGRGRWLVGLLLLAFCGILLAQAAGVAAGARAEAQARVRHGQVPGVPGESVRIQTPRAGAVLVAAGALLVGVAGAEALRRGPRWPALGAAFRAPPDRSPPPPAPEGDEPPWEGD